MFQTLFRGEDALSRAADTNPGFATEGTLLRVLDALPTGLIVMDADGLIDHANESAFEILGPALVGANVAEVFAPLETFKSGLGGERHEVSLWMPRSQKQLEIDFQLTPLVLGTNEPARLLLVFQDATGARRLRQERDRLLQLAAVGNVLPSILHEIKNPLASIGALVELMAEETTDGDMQQDLSAILNEIRRIALTLEGVGRIRHDLRSSRYHQVDQACVEAVGVLRAQAHLKGIQLVVEVPPLPLLPFDTAGFRALVYNLMSNAIQACENGDTISLRIRLEPNLLQLEVEDTGKGMSPEVLQRCQDLFFTTKSKGTGIGLTLCTSLAASAGGELRVDSALEKGTRITVRIPTLIKDGKPDRQGVRP